MVGIEKKKTKVLEKRIEEIENEISALEVTKRWIENELCYRKYPETRPK